MTNQKSKILKIFLLLIFITSYELRVTSYESFAQDNEKLVPRQISFNEFDSGNNALGNSVKRTNKNFFDEALVTLTKQIMEAKDNNQLYAALEELTDLYFNVHKYNEYVELLNSLNKQKKNLEPVTNYYIALSRYYQLKYLEETQNWDEYFNQGNTYRDQIVQSAQKTVDSLGSSNVMSIYARLILWKFHQDQQDNLSESALTDLMNSTKAFAKDATNLVPLKDVAGELSSYGEKAKARQLYKIYVDKIANSDVKDEELNSIALGFYKEGNLELAQGLYDIYIEIISKTLAKENLISILGDIAKAFAYKDEGLSDAHYAEKIFKKIEGIGGKDAFDEELIYLRAFNLEKAKEYIPARDGYMDLVRRYPETSHADEADFKIGIIYTYVTRDIETGKIYFEKLAQEQQTLSPQGISSLYQLGLLSQWQEKFPEAKEHYNKLLEKAKDGFVETVNLTKERIKEIDEGRTIEYNLKTFLDVSLKEEYMLLDTTKLDLRSHPYKTKKDENVNINSRPYLAETGCLQVEIQYLWSGHIGRAKPSLDASSFDTTYPHNGTKEINLVVVSPSGIIDRNLDLIDVY